MKHLSMVEILQIYNGIRLQSPDKFSRYGCLKMAERFLFYVIIVGAAILTIINIIRGLNFFGLLFSYFNLLYPVALWFIIRWQFNKSKEAAAVYNEDEKNLILYFEPEIKAIQAKVEMQAAQQQNARNAQIGKSFGAAGKIVGGLGGGVIGATGGIVSSAQSSLNTGTTQLMNYISLKKAKRAITDAQFDNIVQSIVPDVNLLKNRALRELNIEEETLNELPPLCIKNYFVNEEEDYPLCAIGEDEVTRTSTHQTTWLFFTKKQIGIYDHYTELFNKVKAEDIKEFYWKDVVNILNKTETSKTGLEKKVMIIKDKSGDSFSCVYTDDSDTNRFIQGMKTYFREIKENN